MMAYGPDLNSGTYSVCLLFFCIYTYTHHIHIKYDTCLSFGRLYISLSPTSLSCQTTSSHLRPLDRPTVFYRQRHSTQLAHKKCRSFTFFLGTVLSQALVKLLGQFLTCTHAQQDGGSDQSIRYQCIRLYLCGRVSLPLRRW